MGSTLSLASVAAMFAGGAVFAAEAIGAGAVGRGAAAGADMAGADAAGVDVPSSVANCSTVPVADSSAAVGSTLGQATREFILSARRTGRWVFHLAVRSAVASSPAVGSLSSACARCSNGLFLDAPVYEARAADVIRRDRRIGRLRSAQPRYRQQARSSRQSTPR